MEACALSRTLIKPLNLNLPSLVRCSSTSPSLPAGGGRLLRRAYDALLLDAGGTLLQLARPVADTYASIGQKYGKIIV